MKHIRREITGAVIATALLLTASVTVRADMFDTAPQVGLFLNKGAFVAGDILSLVLVTASHDSDGDVLFSVYLDLGGELFYWPAWNQLPNDVPATVNNDSMTALQILLFTLPSDLPSVGGRIHAFLWENDGGVRGDLLDHQSVPFQIWGQAPTVTPTPPAVTPTPTPTDVNLPCAHGRAVIRVANIPVMTDQNKDEYNKDLLFCLQDADSSNFIGIYHRYLQPDWPIGDWWPTWRVEAGAEGCVHEWHIFESMPLPGNAATFRIEWNRRAISVTHLGTGDTQTLTLDNIAGISQLGEDDACSCWGWESPAVPSLVEWTCSAHGAPSDCSGLPFSPTPTAGPNGPWIAGRAVVRVAGAEHIPDQAEDKGIIFSLDGPDCETAWIRLRDRDLGGEHRADYQAKGRHGDCWAEVNYYQTSPVADGDWTVQWGVTSGQSWITFFAPNSTSQTLNFNHVLAFDHITTANFLCPYPSWPANTNATVISFQGTQGGQSGDCITFSRSADPAAELQALDDIGKTLNALGGLSQTDIAEFSAAIRLRQQANDDETPSPNSAESISR